MHSFFLHRGAIYTFLLFFILTSPFTAKAATVDNSKAQKSAIEAMIKEVIAKNPDIVLDVLKNNSEAVLEIAQQGNLQRRHRMIQAQWVEDAKKPKSVDLTNVAFRGSEKAPVTIIEFTDFTCSYCRQSEVIIEELLIKYGKTIKVVFKPFPKDELPISISAARYSQAAFMQDKEKGWKFYHILFSEPANLESGKEEFLKSAATRVGLDVRKLQADAASKKVTDILRKSNEDAEKLDVSGTPYFLVNNLVIRGAVPKDIFEEAIKMALSIKK